MDIELSWVREPLTWLGRVGEQDCSAHRCLILEWIETAFHRDATQGRESYVGRLQYIQLANSCTTTASKSHYYSLGLSTYIPFLLINHGWGRKKEKKEVTFVLLLWLVQYRFSGSFISAQLHKNLHTYREWRKIVHGDSYSTFTKQSTTHKPLLLHTYDLHPSDFEEQPLETA